MHFRRDRAIYPVLEAPLHGMLAKSLERRHKERKGRIEEERTGQDWTGLERELDSGPGRRQKIKQELRALKGEYSSNKL